MGRAVNHRYWIALLALVFSICIISSSPVFAYGKHTGELKNLEVEVVYTNPYFHTADGLAGYYIGLPMTYELHITNTGKRTFRHLDVTAIQEYHESGTCYRYSEEIRYSKGDPMPGYTTELWEDVALERGEKAIFKGGYVPPYTTCDGLDQTHVTIKHTNNGKAEAATIYFEQEAGVFCPPSPEEPYLEFNA